MDLALQFGIPVSELRHRLTEREFYDWARYAAQKGLPWQRIELHLARIAMFLDIGLLGKKRARLSQYLFDSEAPQDEPLADDIEDAFGGGIVIKRGA